MRHDGTKWVLGLLALSMLSQSSDFARAGHERPYPKQRFEIPIDRAAGTPHHLTDSVSIRALLEVETTFEGNFDLDRGDHEDVLETNVKAKLRATWEPDPHFIAYGAMELSRKFILKDPDGKDADIKFEVKEAFVGFRELGGFSGTIGRRDVSPGREWLFDAEFDGVDLVYRNDYVSVTAAWWREQVLRKDVIGRHRDNRPDFLYLRGDIAIGDDSQVGLWAVATNGRKKKREDDLLFMGLSADGDAGRGFEFWAEGAVVFGEEHGRDVRGWGFDVGGVWTDKSLALRPHVAVGVAFGSGDDGEGTDTAFRQTGAQGNSQHFGGVASIKTYGELIDPELSNLLVTTVGVGFRPFKRTSVDLVYHEYYQHHRMDELRDAKLDEDPSGLARHLGREFDLVIGVKDSELVQIDLVGGVFMPGKAFDHHNDTAWFVESTIEFRF